MTDKQRILYWRMWGEVCRMNDWRWVKGRILASAVRRGTEHCEAWHEQVWDQAERLALQQHRAATAEDLRHGCHVVALGRDRSSTELTNRDLDRVLTLFKLLIDPTDLDALMAWTDPKIGEVKRLDYVIEHAAKDAYVRRISENKFGTRQWEFLDTRQKEQLAMTLKQRKRAWNRAVPAAEDNHGIHPPSVAELLRRTGGTHGKETQTEAAECPF